MSQVVDTKVVEMQFDNSKFEKNIQTSLNSLKFLNKNIEDAGKGKDSLDKLANAGEHVGVSFDNMNAKAKISLNAMDLLAGVGTKAFNKISDAVANFALNMANSLSGMQAMRDGFAEYELKMGSVQTILAGAKIKNPLWSKETSKEQKKWIKDTDDRLKIVNQELENLNTYSDKTIYSFRDMTSNIGKFTNAGVDLKSSVQAIQGVANVAAISGANANEASRAMYNFAQALSSGSVKLIDWKSIENANMATVDFKQQLLDTAVAMGTVVKVGNKYNTVTKNAQGKTFEGFKATTKFNDSLSAQWMTTEVLTQTLRNYSTDVREMTEDEKKAYKAQLKSVGYTDKQIKNIMDLGSKAFDAATEVKTFSQMIDTLKESLGSGWAQTFEILIGDFNESKELWTGVNNVLDGLLTTTGKVRNEILKLWKAEGGRTALINSFSNLYNAIKRMLSPIKDLWEAFTPTKNNAAKMLITLTKGFEKFTALLLKVSPKVAAVISKLIQPLIFIGNKLSRWLPKIAGVAILVISKILRYLGSAFKLITNVGTAIKDAISTHIINRVRTFGETIREKINEIKTRLKSSKSIKELVKIFSDLKNTISDLFGRVVRNASSWVERFASYLGRLWNALKPIVSSTISKGLKSLSNFILPKLRKALSFVVEELKKFKSYLEGFNIKNSRFYKFLSDIPDKITAISNNNTVKKAFSGIKKFGGEAVESLKGKFDSLKSILDSFKMPTGLSDIFSNIKEFIRSIFGNESVGDKATETSDALGDVVPKKSGEELTTFQKFLDNVSTAFGWLKSAANKAKDALAAFIDFVKTNVPKTLKSLHDSIAGEDGIISLTDITDAVDVVSYAISQIMTASGISAFGDAAKNASASFGDLAESVIDVMKKISNNLKMAAFKDFAIAIGIIAAALFVLSQIPDPKKLAAATGALVAVGWAMTKFFDQISTASAKAQSTASTMLPIAALVLAIGAAMIGVALSIGMLVGALAMFPHVIKQYNNLGKDFRTGMDRVKEVLAEIFEYLDHAVNAKYGFRSAAALIGLAVTLDMMRKNILKFASKKMGKSMADGLSRIKEVLDMIGDFLSSLSIASFNGINIGINLNSLGIAATIVALGAMIKMITPSIKEFASLTPDQYKTGLSAVRTILEDFFVFLAGLAAISRFSKTGGWQWIALGATIVLVAAAVSTTVGSIKQLADLATSNAAGLETGLFILAGIFVALGAVMHVIGKMNPKVSAPLFGLSVAIGILTFCVIALAPIAQSHPAALLESVLALGTLMLALGGAMLLAGNAAGETSIKDIVKLIAMVGAMYVLAHAIRRVAKSGASPGAIFAVGVAISGAVLAMAGAMKIMGSIKMINPLVLVGLALLTAAIWGIAYAIKAFKGSAGEMNEGSEQVKAGVENMGEGASEGLKSLASNLDVHGIFDTLGPKIAEGLKSVFGDFDLGSTIRSMIETVKADVKNWAQDFIDVGTNLIDGITKALNNPANISKIKESITGLGKALLDAFKSFFGIASPSTVMEAQGGFILDGLLQGLMEYPSKLADWVSGIGDFIIDGVSSFFSNALDTGKQLVNNLGAGIQNGKAFVTKKASEIGNAALKKVNKAKEWAVQAGKSVNAFGSRLRNSKNPIKSAAGSMIIGATNVVGGLAATYKKTASTAASKFVSEIRAGSNPAKAAGKAIVAGAKAAFTGITSSFLTYGKNAAEGFRNGINSLIAAVAAKAREMVRRAKESAKSEQNSHSPSKDFMEYGGWAAQGYAIGMSNSKSTHLIEDKARSMVNAAKRAVSGSSLGNSLYFDSNPAVRSLAYAMSQISDTMDSGVNSSPTIRPIIDMSNVNSGASAINSLFGNKSLEASLDATKHIQHDFDSTMASRNSLNSMKAIDKLSNRLDRMTETMNSRSLNIYNTIDGASDPEGFANDLIGVFRLNARTV